MAYAPKRTDIVRQTAERYPAAWAKAQTPNDNGEFIRLVAYYLWLSDIRFGLNGKRGTHDISLDAVAYKTPDGSGAGGVEIIDVIASHGASSAHAHWLDQTAATVAKGEVGRWFLPPPPRDEPPSPLPPPGGDLEERIQALEADVARIRRWAESY